MVRFLRALWQQEAGFILSTEIMLLGSALVVGAVAGINGVRDTVVNELNDVGQALSRVDQSYGYSGTYGHGAFTAGSGFQNFRSYPGPYRPGYGYGYGYGYGQGAYGYNYGSAYGSNYGFGYGAVGEGGVCPPGYGYGYGYGYTLPGYIAGYGIPPAYGYGYAAGGSGVSFAEGYEYGYGFSGGAACLSNQCTVVCAAVFYEPPAPRLLDF